MRSETIIFFIVDFTIYRTIKDIKKEKEKMNKQQDKQSLKDVVSIIQQTFKNMEKKRYKIIKGLFYFEIIDTKNNFIVGSQETRSDAERIIKKLEKGEN
tara:strand:- start:44 stop:340 length:297 start_codon:yes stop_codon:yes gene_type:complete